METTLENSRTNLAAAQAEYKREFDRRILRPNQYIAPGEFVYIEPMEGGKKLGAHALGPSQVLDLN